MRRRQLRVVTERLGVRMAMLVVLRPWCAWSRWMWRQGWRQVTKAVKGRDKEVCRRLPDMGGRRCGVW